MYPWNRGRGEWIPRRDKLINQMYCKDLQGQIWKEERGWLSKIHSQIPSPFPGCSYSTPASCFTFRWIPEFGLETQNTAKDYGRKCTKAKSFKSKSTMNVRQSCCPYPHSLACFSSKLLAPRALAASFPLPIQRDWDIPPPPRTLEKIRSTNMDIKPGSLPMENANQVTLQLHLPRISPTQFPISFWCLRSK